MTIEDKQLAAIVKKARCKNNRKHILTVLLMLILFVGAPLTLYLRYYNYGPFQGNKVVGVPDNHLVQSENDNGLSSLLFDYGSHLTFNTNATSMTVYIDTYHFGERVGHDLTQYDYPTADEEFPLPFGGVLSIENDQIEIQKKQDIPLLYLANGNDLKIYEDFENNIAQDNLQTLERVFYIYMIVE
ncbi:hypothetical protein A5886_002640 [Enterococcus sp. 8G7_MSG3316]|uniref:Uncharacterized protein n=1 Tax=Candidatus Enterococcus testudinis TaxID=1834191 RepID=A0A242A9H5_9ENTE|nr:hypothetical protein [Enterococcus sp. 8G7_MSG3316]OTN77540.1 hypothetical protein A5886_002640 [Enterococcus sp. 8G7_MSG3316]